MLEGWYCRTLANEQSSGNQDERIEGNIEVNEDSASDESHDQAVVNDNVNNSIDFKSQYRYLKRKFKFLIYENEFFQDALRVNQRRLLKVSRDRSFLLDRLLQYEKPENTSSESEGTESSEDEAAKEIKKRKTEQGFNNATAGSTRGRKRKNPNTVQIEIKTNNSSAPSDKIMTCNLPLNEEHTHMTAAEVERHLQSKQPIISLISERASATVPNEMFSNEPSLDSESNDHIIDGSSPTHVAAEECVQMEYSNI